MNTAACRYRAKFGVIAAITTAVWNNVENEEEFKVRPTHLFRELYVFKQYLTNHNAALIWAVDLQNTENRNGSLLKKYQCFQL